MTKPPLGTEYPIKVLGINTPDFIDEIKTLVSEEVNIISYKTNESFQGRFISITFLTDSPSEASIKALFDKLSERPSVKLVL